MNDWKDEVYPWYELLCGHEKVASETWECPCLEALSRAATHLHPHLYSVNTKKNLKTSYNDFSHEKTNMKKNIVNVLFFTKPVIATVYMYACSMPYLNKVENLVGLLPY